MNSKKNKSILEEYAVLNSLGLLDKNEKDSLLKQIADPENTGNDLVKDFNNLASLITRAFVFSNKEITPSPKIKEMLFEKIKSGSEKQPVKNKSGFEFILADSNDWVPHPEIEGVQVKKLALNLEKGYLMILMKATAGAEYPSHHHSGAEECYVLEGDLFVEGKNLGPGDFHHAEGHSDHDPLRTKNGVTLLLVVDPRDY